MRADAHTVTNLLDSHVFKLWLIHFHEVLAINMVFYLGQHKIGLGSSEWKPTLEQLDILRAVDTLEPICNLVFVPMPDSIRRVVHLGELRLGGRSEEGVFRSRGRSKVAVTG